MEKGVKGWFGWVGDTVASNAEPVWEMRRKEERATQR
jgi:hypothetical protein